MTRTTPPIDGPSVTADTITDEQIRALVRDTNISFDTAYRAAWRERLPGESKAAYQRSRNVARERCAAAWNARMTVRS